jgi:hypothetical protein
VQPDLELEISAYFELSYCLSGPRVVSGLSFTSSGLTNDDAGSFVCIKAARDDRESFLMCATI